MLYRDPGIQVFKPTECFLCIPYRLVCAILNDSSEEEIRNSIISQHHAHNIILFSDDEKQISMKNKIYNELAYIFPHKYLAVPDYAFPGGASRIPPELSIRKSERSAIALSVYPFKNIINYYKDFWKALLHDFFTKAGFSIACVRSSKEYECLYEYIVFEEDEEE